VDAIRILLAGMPRLMADIVAFGLAAEPDMLIVGSVEAVDALAVAVDATRPDFLVVGVDGEDLPVQCGPVLAEQPELRVLGIEQDRVEAGLYELRPHRVALGVMSPEELAATIRGAAGQPSRLWEVVR
jgi:hypothetical protein